MEEESMSKKSSHQSPAKHGEEAASAKKTSKPNHSRILVKYNVGMTNTLYIRGQGAGLTWEKGSPMKNVGPDEWIWETATHFKECEFKVLINDKQYEDGENHHLFNGGAIQYTPHFS
jgi:hypothetical protein